ncbi:hypothetical protein Tsubulata_047054 [Turnera subulata]|uniref:CCHC-type domain-containing protein n=1 Tax=Turnera subulata TaxID=218843 RepID=A0A9Q0JL62_9ROSI|nr:hypothetical protein Tsubulata_047054 [Turnera subulata]
MLCNRLQRLWGLHGTFRVIYLDHNYYLVKTANSQDYMHVMTGGPWVILDHYLTVEPWQPNFEPSSHKVTSVVAWIRVSGLSTELYQRAILREVCFSCGPAGHLMVNCRAETPIAASNPVVGQMPTHSVSTNLETIAVRPVPSNPQRLVVSQNKKYSDWILEPMEDSPAPAPVKQRTGSASRVDYQGTIGASTTKTEAVGSVGNSVGKTVSTGLSKGVFIADSSARAAEGDNMSVKRSRGPTGYTLTGDAIVQAALDKPKRQEKLKKAVVKESVQAKNVDNIWAGVLAKDAPVPVSFMPSAVSSPAVQASPATVLPPPQQGDSVPTVEVTSSSPMQVAFDLRGQRHSDSVSLVDVASRVLKEPDPDPIEGSNTAAFVTLGIVGVNEDKQGIARGLVESDFGELSEDLVFAHRPQIVILLETKVLFSAAIDVIRGCGFDRSEVEEVQGRSGGIWICWRHASAVLSVELQHVQFLHVKVKFGNMQPWFLTAVYASPSPSIRQEFWAATRTIADSITRPWFLVRDFNTYIDQSEKL